MLAALALALALAVPTYGPVPQASASPPTVLRVPTAANVAMIVNSGSTNTAGYQLTVNEDGTAALVQGDVTLKKQIPALLVRRFFDDLRAAGPVDALQAGACMKSASFGTTTRILYRGKTSPASRPGLIRRRAAAPGRHVPPGRARAGRPGAGGSRRSRSAPAPRPPARHACACARRRARRIRPARRDVRPDRS